MMKHDEIQQILAAYRDATAEERAAADTHLAGCPACAAAFAAYGEVDTLLAAAPDRTLPPRLARSFASILREGAAAGTRGSLGFAFGRSLAPAAVVMFILIAVSALLWSLNSGGAPVTSTPTLTTTLTPTTITARETGPAVVALAAAQRPLAAPDFVPTPAPAPAPRGNLGPLFAGPSAHATITH